MNDQKREAELKEGKVEGDTVTFVELLKIQDNEIRISLHRQNLPANEIKFTREVGDFGIGSHRQTRRGAQVRPAAGQRRQARRGVAADLAGRSS